jgi:light-regulated signal transduction histidine kinase (bacteriophytochrome)
MSTVQIAAQTKNIEIVLTSPLEFDPPPLLGDSFRVQQCLLNLLSNAAKFSKEGAILISYTCEPSASRDRLITISVKDNGRKSPLLLALATFRICRRLSLFPSFLFLRCHCSRHPGGCPPESTLQAVQPSRRQHHQIARR